MRPGSGREAEDGRYAVRSFGRFEGMNFPEGAAAIRSRADGEDSQHIAPKADPDHPSRAGVPDTSVRISPKCTTRKDNNRGSREQGPKGNDFYGNEVGNNQAGDEDAAMEEARPA